MTKNQKIGVAVGAVLLAGGLYFFLTRKKRACIKGGGQWDKANKTCIQEALKKAYENLTFQSGKAVINSSSFASLDGIVKYLSSMPKVSLSIEGHTDSQGDEAYNQKLSEDRAAAVRTYLIGKGVAADRIASVGYGESKPLGDNETAQGREQNRRVEFVIA